MEIIPAIDIKDGRCVRLYQGDFAQMTVYADDPVAVARRWQAQGATRIHVVDLDGARTGRPQNVDAVLAITQTVQIPVQLGGGLRREEDVAAALALGVERVIIGTAAIVETELVARLLERFGERIIIGIDARNGMVATDGWTVTSTIAATDLAGQMAALGARRFIYTDISRDGALSGPNFTALAELVKPDGPAIIASGGIANLDHIRQLAQIGVEGVIIGKALYTGAIYLPEAIAIAQTATG
ncbi:1-(5-phosphoribosyl)-5-[(5-phosphoribosylamino)methylideneamino]imidazole-4-carboxamide isomerase [Chloroflexus aggregans]|uniref:1-(5-phosphoribosyl)-5-[(5-phosphoribosylamino)methylideneamino] imidazole-4-carboxamide isomerase n=1 Tax=Chloroflexus aggregans (strain MD-66 / DSM 9485) TaxID=326427 RepID=HIS4_CHLAD|nr:1-(5-phosphoribosyl)-5-[(5-phosphoribosylamino)methylideneamino]imidazole-4-carboxamide isomerase [Chloroflexus aggregans]B8G9S2.1 RecName: Full=1-(5-phosphoribosyl)-5-[(5-phosphoribosylamino)methylideneamino] imidazole-4-carboxamide isomerase; AltName: Full=Phosphoribosylformimino-5-aminoimidazole carboxamide ribotide isomerase [Chloroflexus aggregans DSM 9485]ACL26425.1 phosphoribosylformimino-5-aminoimidazole carboxamide ribotide isomerase [Chloroflexus aggregans DSM 9485]